MNKLIPFIALFLFALQAKSNNWMGASTQERNQKLHDTTTISNLINKAKIQEKERDKGIEVLKNTLSVIDKALAKNYTIPVQQKLKLQLANTNSEIGKKFIELSQVKLAIPYLFEALKYYEIVENKNGVAKTYMNIGLAFNNLKDYKKSKKYYDQATKLCIAIKDWQTLGKVYNNYSVNLYEQNQKEESTAYVYKALNVFKKVNDKQGISYCLYNLAQKFNDAGNPQKAMPYLMESLEMRKAIADTRGIAESLNAIGICYRWMNDIPSALTYLNEANQLAQKNGFFHVLESSSDMLNYIYEEDLKDHENALKSYRLYIAARDTIINEKAKIELLEKHYEYEYETKKALIQKQTEADKAKQKLIFIVIVSILILLLLLVLAWFYFYKKKKGLEKEIEKKAIALEVAEAERRRISADLHDDLGVGISTINLLGNRIKMQDDLAIIKADAQNIIENTKKVNEKLTEVIWELNAEHNNLEHLLLFIQKQGQQVFKETAIDFSMLIPLDLPNIFLSSYQRKQLYFVVKEAFHNILKHAHATQVSGKVKINGTIKIEIADNGQGFDVNEKLNPTTGEGLTNMKNRLADLNGKLDLVSNSNGTRITIEIPLP
jgi:signal transduction histidine kinase/Tfp pilus assembly major pilin PilA